MNTSVKQGSVIVGVDGSAGGAVALEWAAHHASARHRPLVLAHGAGDPTASSRFVGTQEARQRLRHDAHLVTDHALGVVHTLAPTVDVQVTAPLHDARQVLLELSDRASIVVVGTRGRGPLGALLLGSVSTAVAEHATCPVAVVRADTHDTPERRAAVVVGVEAGATSQDALELAFDLASTERRPLRVVHSWSDVDLYVDRSSLEQQTARADSHQRLLAEALAGFAEKYPDVAVTRHIPDSSPIQSLVAMSRDAAMVVVGSRGLVGLRAVLGSVSRDVVQRAECTVVVARS